MKVIFFGTSEFAVPALKALHLSSHKVVAVFTAPPKPAGRGKQLRKSAVHLIAEELGFEVRTPSSLKNEPMPEADFGVVAAYGLLLPQAVLDAPKHGCLNIHPSDLPRWRGAAPIQRAIMAGDTQTAVCIMQMDAGLDTGDVLHKAFLPIAPNETAGSLHDKTAILGGVMTVEVIDDFAKFPPQKQGEEGMTYAKKIAPEDEKIDWSKTAQEVSCQIRGLSPYPSSYFEFDGQKIKVFQCNVVQSLGDAATAIDDKLTIACGQGAVQITELQRPGKRAMSAKDFLQGFKIPAGAKLQ